MRLFVVPSVLLAFSFFFNQSKAAGQQVKNQAGLSSGPVVYDELQLTWGLEVKDFEKRRCIQLKEDAGRGLAEVYVFEPSASYDLSVFYVDENVGASELAISINDRPAGTIRFDGETKGSASSFTFRKKTLPAIPIQQWSRIALEFTGDGAERCRVEKIVLTRTGAFQGKTEFLKKPATLQVFESSSDRLGGRELLPRYVNGRIDQLMAQRVAALTQLTTPAEWKAQQDKVRSKLDKFFGTFPERTPLNAKITGKTERENYTIEKLYFESQPGYYVTANLYTPRNRPGPLPAVLFTCGHSEDGKASALYHSACLGLVHKGYVVLAFDPTGQGERLEYFSKDPKDKNVQGAVDQHYYLGRPSFLVDWTLSGLRVWDGIRALDYLVSRPEVDTAKIAAVGNSGGGQMALLITAVDQRIKVCAAGHPGGQMEKNYLQGQNLFDRQLFSLIAPRPVRVIVGDRSGEEAPHRKKVEDMQLFLQGLGYEKDRAQLVMVDGVHDLMLPKRVAVYEWLNKWFDKEEEGSAEAPLKLEDQKDLWVTNEGLTLLSLGGESGQTLNAKRLSAIYRPAKNASELKERIAARIGWTTHEKTADLAAQTRDTLDYGDLSIEKLTYQSEEGVVIPALLLKPKKSVPNSAVYIYVSDRGKPGSYQDTAAAFALAKQGFVVLAIDVRGTGEISPTASLPSPVTYSSCTSQQWIQDCLDIQSPGFGRTMLAMRTFDLVRGIDYLLSRRELKGRKIRVYGEGGGGLWALLAAVYDPRVEGVVTDGTLVSYKQLVTNRYYAVPSAYFWAPGALCDFDIPDLARLAASKRQVWVNPINGLGRRLSTAAAAPIIGTHKNIQIVSSQNRSTADILRIIQP
jgi:cephalosporin-C deacetylase-like acetyl esterase